MQSFQLDCHTLLRVCVSAHCLLQQSTTFLCLQFSKANNNEELKAIVENYQEVLRTRMNVKNLHMFVEAFHK